MSAAVAKSTYSNTRLALLYYIEAGAAGQPGQVLCCHNIYIYIMLPFSVTSWQYPIVGNIVVVN